MLVVYLRSEWHQIDAVHSEGLETFYKVVSRMHFTKGTALRVLFMEPITNIYICLHVQKCTSLTLSLTRMIKHVQGTHKSWCMQMKLLILVLCSVCIKQYNVSHTHLWLAVIVTLPVTTWPELTRMGCGRRQRIWYQWVSGCVGAVESHTVSLVRGYVKGCGLKCGDVWVVEMRMWECGLCGGVWVWRETHWEPEKATSNQKASPCIIPVVQSVYVRGMVILEKGIQGWKLRSKMTKETRMWSEPCLLHVGNPITRWMLSLLTIEPHVCMS